MESNEPRTIGMVVKETLQSVVVAFILAFIFRAFVVEAFVIPTGSMASTLMGKNVAVRCPDCGYEYEVGYDGSNVLRSTMVLSCPSCGYEQPRVDGPRPELLRPRNRSGDRILVQKYAYLWNEPERWDVVVFKSPYEAETKKYQENYIKRLVGGPSEAVMILDGDVYSAAWAPGRQVTAGDFKVRVKPRHVQQAMWRVVHDADFVPLRLPRPHGVEFVSPWTAGAGWTATGRTFACGAGATGGLVFNADANRSAFGGPDLFGDGLAYNANSEGRVSVSDIKIAFTHEVVAAGGAMTVLLRKHADEFALSLGGDATRLDWSVERVDSAGLRTRLGGGSVARSAKARVEYWVADYRVNLRVDDRDIWSSDDAQYAPDVASLVESARFTGDVAWNTPATPRLEFRAGGQGAEVSHVSVWRDVHYSSDRGRPGHSAWGSPVDFPQNVILLDAGEYFVLGDNTRNSADSRVWDEPINLPAETILAQSGRVPRKFLLGRAFYVYWPAASRESGGLSWLIPNFAEMRFIH